MSRSPSFDCYLVAALLVLFGLPKTSAGHPLGAVEFVLALVAVAAGVYLRTGTPAARVAAIGAHCLIVVVGVIALTTGAGYVAGSIISLFAVFRLVEAGVRFRPAPSAAAPQVGDVRPGQALAGWTPYASPTGAPAPQSQTPQYQAPQYQSPQYQSPQHHVPGYPPAQQPAPQFQAAPQHPGQPPFPAQPTPPYPAPQPGTAPWVQPPL